MRDYVVALNVEDGSVVAVWPGERYRNYDQTNVHQYQVSMAGGPNDAVQRALLVRQQLKDSNTPGGITKALKLHLLFRRNP